MALPQRRLQVLSSDVAGVNLSRATVVVASNEDLRALIIVLTFFSEEKIWLESVLRLVEVEVGQVNEQLARGCGVIEQLGRSTAKAFS